MNIIHHKMLLALQDKQGQILTTKAIKHILLQCDPTLNFLSILPGDHAAGPQQGKYCHTCRLHPLLERIGHGVYRILKAEAEPLLPSLHQQLAYVLLGKEGQLLTTAEIKTLVKEHYPHTHVMSLFPSEHMYGGPCRICATQPLFGRQSRGLYRVLSFAERSVAPTPILQAYPRQQLVEWFGLHSHSELLHPPTHLEKRLQATCATYQRETHLLICALQERIPFDLKEFDDLVSRDTLYERLTERLYHNWGIAKELGRWAVESWDMAVHQPDIRSISHLAVAETAPAYLSGREQAIQSLWNNEQETDWRKALDHFWLQNRHNALVLEMDNLPFMVQQAHDVADWYEFLSQRLLRWLCPEPQAYESRLYDFKRHYHSQRQELDKVVAALFTSQPEPMLLTDAASISGLGIEGGSALLSLLFPQQFARIGPELVTVFQSLGEQIPPFKNLTLDDVLLLIDHLKYKAETLNQGTDYWTPRKIELALVSAWRYGKIGQSVTTKQSNFKLI